MPDPREVIARGLNEPPDEPVTCPPTERNPPMPATVTLRGYSDDLIDLSGAIAEEWGVSDDASIVAFSDGTAARIEYDADGVWRIATLKVGPGSEVKHLPAVVGDDENYSDVLTVTGYLAWAVLGESIAYPSGAPR